MIWAAVIVVALCIIFGVWGEDGWLILGFIAFYGFENKEPIWGDYFYKALVNSKMGLNLSRGKPTKYYSSNRIASIIGNGLLTFVDKKVMMNDFFNNNELRIYTEN